ALDAGPILLQERLPISDSDDYLSLEQRLADLGADLLVRAIAERPEPYAQDDSLATFAPRIDRNDARIDWTRPATEIWNMVRAYRGWPQAFTSFDGRLLKVLRATPIHGTGNPGTVSLEEGVPIVATAQDRLRLDEVQLEGR